MAREVIPRAGRAHDAWKPMLDGTNTSVQASALRGLLKAAVTGDCDSMADLVTADVTGWSPDLFVTSRDDLIAALEPREAAFSGIEIGVNARDHVGDKAIAEWHMAADHTGPLAVDDDLVIEPTGRRIHLSGATVAEFDGDASAPSVTTSTTSRSSSRS